jgi:hypothetical protein
MLKPVIFLDDVEPPPYELVQPSAMFFQSENIPRTGPVAMLLGTFENMSSKINAPFDACYLWAPHFHA